MEAVFNQSTRSGPLHTIDGKADECVKITAKEMLMI